MKVRDGPMAVLVFCPSVWPTEWLKSSESPAAEAVRPPKRLHIPLEAVSILPPVLIKPFIS